MARSSLLLPAKVFARDLRTGELSLLLAALVIAVASVTAIWLFADRLQLLLVQQSATFLAADRVLEAGEPLDAWLPESEVPGIRQARMLQFLTMVFTEEAGQLASVKAVDGAYPLRGSLQLAEEAFGESKEILRGPQKGQVWMDSRLAASLNLQLPALVEVGSSQLLASAVVIREPDPGGGIERVAPRLMMHLDDVPATRVVQPGSRISYRRLFAGESPALRQLDALMQEKTAGTDASYYSARERVSSIGSRLNDAENFLLLGSLLTVLLAAVVIASAARRYAERHLNQVAVYKSLGAGPGQVNRLFLLVFCLLLATALLPGLLLGLALDRLLAGALGSLFPVDLPDPGFAGFGIGVLTAVAALAAFGLPPLLSLARVSAMNVIRRDMQGAKVSLRLQYALGIAGLAVLLLLFSQNLLLTFLLLVCLALALACTTFLCWCLLHTGGFVRAGSIWYLAWKSVRGRALQNSVQVSVLAITIMLMLTLLLMRISLISGWQAQLPDEAPNHFLINIAPHEVTGIQTRLQERGLASQALYPMIRGRLVKVNGQSAKQHLETYGDPAFPAPDGTLSRNLTWSETLPVSNEVTAGRFHFASPHAELSAEVDWAGRNGIKLNDLLTFLVHGEEVQARVSSLREVDWGGLSPNFYLVFSSGPLQDFSATFITSFYLPPDDRDFLVELLHTWPTLTLIGVDAVIREIQGILQQVTLAVELLLVLVLISGFLVMLASLQASLATRMQEQALLRALGASSRLIQGSLLVEFCILGLVAGLLAAGGGELLAFLLQTWILRLGYQPYPLVWFIGIGCSVLLFAAAGFFATRHLVRVPPNRILRGDMT